MNKFLPKLLCYQKYSQTLLCLNVNNGIINSKLHSYTILCYTDTQSCTVYQLPTSLYIHSTSWPVILNSGFSPVKMYEEENGEQVISFIMMPTNNIYMVNEVEKCQKTSRDLDHSMMIPALFFNECWTCQPVYSKQQLEKGESSFERGWKSQGLAKN